MDEVPETSNTAQARQQLNTPLTSRTCNRLKTPMSRRLTARREATQHRTEGSTHDYKDLLMKTWMTYSLSPLYNFKYTSTAFSKYARSLDVALSQEKFGGDQTDEHECQKSSFNVYEGLNHQDSDAQAVQIKVTASSGKNGKVVMNAIMICVDLDGSAVAENLRGHFTYYPVIMIMGSKARSEILLHWLEQHFDCHTAPVKFNDNDMRWMLAAWSCQDVDSKSFPVLLQYSLSDVCDGISTIDCKFDTPFCRQLWQSLIGDVSTREQIYETEVKQFVDAIEQHLENIMHILFSKLSLSEVGTSVAYVASDGKLKLFSSKDVFLALHLVCDIVKDKYMSIGYRMT